MSAQGPVGAQPRSMSPVAIRAFGVTSVVLLLGAAHGRHQPRTICPLRLLTGIPCPFCGGTTAWSELGRGHLRAAIAASPLALVLVIWLPVANVAPRPTWWVTRTRWRVALITMVLASSEIWQLVRLHVI